MPGGGTQPAGTQTTTQLPPQYMYPYIGTGLDQAGQLYASGGPQYYPGSTVAQFSDPQQKAMTQAFRLGMGKTGMDGINDANSFDKMLLEGGGTNPWLDETFDQAAGATRNQLSSEFAGSGRNVAASEPLRAEQLNHLATDIYGGAYDNNMNRALQAGNQVQDIYRTRLGGVNEALGIGDKAQSQAQRMIDADKAKFDFYQNAPQNNLMAFLKEIGSVQPGSATNSPFYTNPTANAAGVASIIASLYSMFGSSGAAAAAA